MLVPLNTHIEYFGKESFPAMGLYWIGTRNEKPTYLYLKIRAILTTAEMVTQLARQRGGRTIISF